MLSRRTWIGLAAVLLAWGIWHGAGEVEVVYSTRYTDDAVYRSTVACGNASAIVFLGRQGDEVLGPATAADCAREARTRVAEVGAMLLGAAALVVVGMRYGKEPPRPIDDELRPLPQGERSVEGRRRRPHRD